MDNNIVKIDCLGAIAIIEHYRRRESSVEESLIEMYLAGVSVCRVEDVTELLWGSRISDSTVSSLNQNVYGKIEERLIERKSHRQIYLTI